MSAFKEACEVETEAMKDVVPFLHAHSHKGRFVLTNKGRLSKELQKQYGDAMAETSVGITAVEVKAEFENKYGNLFLETWSNRERFTPGWMFTLNADYLLYYFLTERQMLSIRFPLLRRWAFHEGRIYEYEEKCQAKYSQRNDTWGRCVPIDVVREEVTFNEYQFSGDHGRFTKLS
jgi:hypothetical protein